MMCFGFQVCGGNRQNKPGCEPFCGVDAAFENDGLDRIVLRAEGK
jgi:hypothetical protein